MRVFAGKVMFDQRRFMESSSVPPPLPGSGLVPPSYRFSKLGSLLAVLAIATCAVLVVRIQTAHRAEPDEEVRPNRILELMARYVVGVKSLLHETGQWDAKMNDKIMKDVENVSRKDVDALRMVILKSWMTNEPPAEGELTKLAEKDEGLRTDVEMLRKLNVNRDVTEDAGWKPFLKHHGWLAQLARARTLDEKDPARQQITQQALGTAMIMIGAGTLGMMAAVGGVVLLILAIVRWHSGKLRMTLERPACEHGGVLVEGFAIYLALFLLLPGLLRFLPMKLPGWAGYAIGSVALILGMMWPRLRGMSKATWREIAGLHRGEGVLREIGAGLLGWVTALPLLAVGIMAASWIMRLTGDFPSHPIVDVFAGDAWAKFGAIMLAVVWAPITEELTFRGLLFPGLSAWMRWTLGILLSAFVFAVIHPQGWAGVPAIMALAATFSLLRMWRRSLIAPMTAHALNNGIMCVMMLLL